MNQRVLLMPLRRPAAPRCSTELNRLAESSLELPTHRRHVRAQLEIARVRRVSGTKWHSAFGIARRSFRELERPRQRGSDGAVQASGECQDDQRFSRDPSLNPLLPDIDTRYAVMREDIVQPFRRDIQRK